MKEPQVQCRDDTLSITFNILEWEDQKELFLLIADALLEKGEGRYCPPEDRDFLLSLSKLVAQSVLTEDKRRNSDAF